MSVFSAILGSTVDTCSCVSQSTDNFALFWVKVDSDPEVDARPSYPKLWFLSTLVFATVQRTSKRLNHTKQWIWTYWLRGTHGRTRTKQLWRRKLHRLESVNLDWSSDNPQAGDTYHDKFMDWSDVKGRERGWLSVLQHDDQSEEHHCEGVHLDQSCRQRNCVPVVRPDSRATLHDDRVVLVREEPNVHFEFYQWDVADGMESPSKNFMLSWYRRVLRRWSKLGKN